MTHFHLSCKQYLGWCLISGQFWDVAADFLPPLPWRDCRKWSFEELSQTCHVKPVLSWRPWCRGRCCYISDPTSFLYMYVLDSLSTHPLYCTMYRSRSCDLDLRLFWFPFDLFSQILAWTKKINKRNHTLPNDNCQPHPYKMYICWKGVSFCANVLYTVLLFPSACLRS